MKPRFKKKVKLIDIASKAGVSIGTASRVLNGKTDVNPELVGLVQNAAKTLGYFSSDSSKKIKSSPKSAMGTVGYLVDLQEQSGGVIFGDSFQQGFLEGIDQEVSRCQGNVLFSSCRDDIENGRLPAFISDRSVMGVVLKIGSNVSLDWIQKIQQRVPLVMVMSREPSHSVSSVMCDNFNGVYQALCYLKSLGHRSIGFMADRYQGIPQTVHHMEREEAFRRLIPLLGLNEDPQLIQVVVRDSQKETLNEVMETGLNRLLALKSKRPTAILCAADVYAFALMQVAASKGISIPKDLSLIGFMNTDLAQHSNPALTSVSLSEFEIGRAAVDLLQYQMENPEGKVRHLTVGTSLIERKSCAKL
ncbi:MAG: LacI family DNA-binding transcriptional regulator [Verrucomicrobiota bacterium]